MRSRNRVNPAVLAIFSAAIGFGLHALTVPDQPMAAFQTEFQAKLNVAMRGTRGGVLCLAGAHVEGPVLNDRQCP